MIAPNLLLFVKDAHAEYLPALWTGGFFEIQIMGYPANNQQMLVRHPAQFVRLTFHQPPFADVALIRLLCLVKHFPILTIESLQGSLMHRIMPFVLPLNNQLNGFFLIQEIEITHVDLYSTFPLF